VIEVTGIDSDSSSGMSVVLMIGGGVVLIAILALLVGFIMARQGESIQGDTEQIIEAEIIDEENLFSLTVAELKQRLAEQGLPVSGNKGELIARLTSQTA
jgi:hypothetical protein